MPRILANTALGTAFAFAEAAGFIARLARGNRFMFFLLGSVGTSTLNLLGGTAAQASLRTHPASAGAGASHWRGNPSARSANTDETPTANTAPGTGWTPLSPSVLGFLIQTQGASAASGATSQASSAVAASERSPVLPSAALNAADFASAPSRQSGTAHASSSLSPAVSQPAQEPDLRVPHHHGASRVHGPSGDNLAAGAGRTSATNADAASATALADADGSGMISTAPANAGATAGSALALPAGAGPEPGATHSVLGALIQMQAQTARTTG
jgi:hypothetical protein